MGIVAFIERASKSISDMVGGSTKEATASGAEPREQQRTHDQTGRFVSPTKDKKRHRADNEIPQLQNRRISALKEGTAKRNRQAQNYREPSTSVETSPTGPLPVNASSQGSLGIGDGRIYIGPPIDIDRAKALYFPIEGPCRMHTVWLPSNLTVSQKEYARKKPAVEELEVKEESMYASARSDVNSDVTVDCEDKVSESVVVVGPTQELQQTAIKAEEGIDGEKGAEGQATTVAPVPAADLPQVDAVPNLNKESHTEDNPPIVVESHGGYRSAIATHGIHRGAAVFEVKVESDVSQKNIFGLRLGWSTMSIELDRILHQPVGAIHSDGYGFNVINTEHSEGSVFFSLRKGNKREISVSKLTKNAVKKGDVFGIVISVGDQGEPYEITQDNIVQFRGTMRDHVMTAGPDWLEKRQPQAGSYAELFWNGKSQGRTFINEILESTYYPMISLYTSVDVDGLPCGATTDRLRVQVTFDASRFDYVYPKGLATL